MNICACCIYAVSITFPPSSVFGFATPFWFFSGRIFMIRKFGIHRTQDHLVSIYFASSLLLLLFTLFREDVSSIPTACSHRTGYRAGHYPLPISFVTNLRYPGDFQFDKCSGSILHGASVGGHFDDYLHCTIFDQRDDDHSHCSAA